MAPDFQNHFRFLGLRCQDRITGFVGVGSSVCFDVYGCIQTALTPPFKPEDKEPGKSFWFDNNRIEIVDVTVVQPLPDFLVTPKAKDAPGGFDKPGR